MIYIVIILLILALILIIWAKKTTKLISLNDIDYENSVRLLNSIVEKGKNRAFIVFKLKTDEKIVQWYKKVVNRKNYIILGFPINELYADYQSGLENYLKSKEISYNYVEYEKDGDILITDKYRTITNSPDFLEISFDNIVNAELLFHFIVYDLFQYSKSTKLDVEIAYKGA